MKLRKSHKVWIFSTLNAFIMLALSFYWLSLPYTFGDEAFLIKWTSLVKKSLMGIDPKPTPESVLFVDISESKTTLNQPNEFGELSPYHRKVITDRADLSAFFDMIAPFADQTRLVVVDVLFSDTSPQDSLLQASAAQLGDRLLGVSHIEDGKNYIEPVIELPTAVATYRAAQGMFLKYPLIMGDSLPTVPLAIYQSLHHATFTHGGWFQRVNDRVSLPAPVVDFKVRPNDFRVGEELSEKNFAIYNMGTILESRDFMLEEDIAAFFKGKLIMVGDFETDIHSTPFGQMPGLLLIYNAYLTLADRDNIVSPFWVLLLLCGYWVICWRIFTNRKVVHPRWLSSIFRSKAAQFVLNALDEAVLLIIITILSYFLFNIHINILILLVYAKIMEYIWINAPTLRLKFSRPTKVGQV